ncbi:MAG: orotidine-5'-phosphate decarboxylase, partial [Nocardioidaceae bacterium]
PLCVGIDPHAALLSAWGLDDSPAGLESFALTCVEALAADVAVLKPQSAFFERHGAAGIGVLEKTVRAARDAGALVLLDAKRGDIGSTMQGYAEAYLDQSSPIAVDAMTVTPYLGFESLRPVLDIARSHGAGVFVVTLTSNPEGPEVQHATTSAGSVAAAMLSAIAKENVGAEPMGSVGAVVAANLADCVEDLAVNGPLLAPGYGAQGGAPDDLHRIFAGVESTVLPSTSREVLGAGPSATALRDAARRSIDAVRVVLGC